MVALTVIIITVVSTTTVTMAITIYQIIIMAIVEYAGRNYRIKKTIGDVLDVESSAIGIITMKMMAG